MPTGYTADVQSGKVTDFKTFAWQCARAFGALITMRDDPSDARIPEEFKPDDYYLTAVQQAEVRLGRVLAMTPAECDGAAKREHDEAEKYAADYVAKKAQERQRYQAMIEKVEAWKVPSSEHAEMKSFMLEQLRKSIDFDCGDGYTPAVEPLLSGVDWRHQQIARLTQALDRSRESLREEEERCRKRSEWVRQLRESL